MNIDEAWLTEQKACPDGVEWFLAQAKTDSIEVLESLISENKLDWASWLMVRLLDSKQNLEYAVYSAQKIVDLFGGTFPGGERPDLAVAAARNAVEGVSEGSLGEGDSSAIAAGAQWAAAWVSGGDSVDSTKKAILAYGIELLRG
jgi:hypothetical protein